jgi:hypothetical protein
MMPPPAAPNGASPYPAAPQTPPSGVSNPQPYRPGSVTEFIPRKSGNSETVASGTGSAESGTEVTPASYEQPINDP